jgi:hypothetical protein
VDAAVDDRGVAVPDPRHRPRQLVGVLRAGLGWLVVLGPGGERILHALAAGHGPHPLPGRHGAARRLPRLDGAARHIRFQPQPAGHLPRALRGPGLRARLRNRSGTRRVHPRLPAAGGGRCCWARSTR